jgi:lipopolysaccharide export system permease protein
VRLLDRYLLRELLVPLGYCLGGFLVFYIAFDLIFEINRFQEGHLAFLDVVKYYIVTLPELLVGQIIPVSLLLAALYALTNHSRYHELIAMRAAGVGMWRLAVPYFGVGVLCGVVIFAINELWVPQAADKAKDILETHKAGVDRKWAYKLDFENELGRRHWIIAKVNRKTAEMIQPIVTWELPDGSRHEIFAQRGIYTNGEWLFYDIEKWDRAVGDIVPQQTSNTVMSVPLPETPAWIRSEIKVNTLNAQEIAKGPQLSIYEILTYLHLHPHLSREKSDALLTQLHGRIAEPFTCVAVILIALPFGARSGRHNVFAGVAGSIFICFAYFILQRVSFDLGVGGYLPPVLAAWLPNAIFGGAGLALMSRLR